MIFTSIKKSVLLLFIAHCMLLSQERQLTPEILATKFEVKLKGITNKKLLAFSQSVGKNPETFLSNVPTFHQNGTWWTCVQSPLHSLSKLPAYFLLCRSINKEMYLPEAFAILEAANHPQKPWESQEDYYKHLGKLETLTDRPDLKKQATQLFNKEWPFYSVRADLAAHQLELAGLRNEFMQQKQKLALSQQTDRKLGNFESKIDENIDSLRHAIHAITYRKEIIEICKNLLGFIMQKIKENSLEQELDRLNVAFPLENINSCFEAHYNLPLLHSICLSEELELDAKQNAIELLFKRGIIMNEHDSGGKTILDKIPSANSLYAFLQKRNARHSIPSGKATKGVLKQSYDTPPASPDTSNTSKRTLQKPFRSSRMPIK